MTHQFRYVHETGPLDFWAGLVTLREIIDSAKTHHKNAIGTLETIDTDNLRGAISEIAEIPYIPAVMDGINLDEACRAIADAMTVLRLSPFSWEGDARGLDSVALMMRPDECDTKIWGVVIKQDNNGSTFVISDVPWPWATPGMKEWTMTVDPEAQWRKDRGYPDEPSCDECGGAVAEDQVTCQHCGLDLPRNGRVVEFRDGLPARLRSVS
ncbi:MAG: hypothetical protein EOM91_16690 [Sphingobacteriia bacterium]|nr:hypothetical protein [Sphingobacteriia bacterium]